ncbi:transposase [Arthrobacter stackebrandtii]|uniref:Transposase n=1 Tax=Arthrobacter stackebrandtii TaxID=272161 RepID=A0ABS4YWT5_9MICC|nr:transposase [Arthrobacter stackebrandtii]
MVEIREVLRAWLDGAGLRTVGERAGVDRKTARRYVQAAEAAGLVRDAGPGAVTDELVGAVVAAVRPSRPNGHGPAWEALAGHEEQIRAWVTGTGTGKAGRALNLVKVHELLSRQGCQVPYRTLHRFATERCGYRVKTTTVRVADGEPGVECQIDFAYMGTIKDAHTGKDRKVHALIFTAVYSRHMFVWLTYTQTLAAVIAGCEMAWAFFGGVFKVLIPDNMKPVVTAAEPVNPRFSTGWLDYAAHAGFATDAARVRTPLDKPRVERVVQYVRGNFFAGETFADLEDAQVRAVFWCQEKAGMRVHGTTQAHPAEVFAAEEASELLPAPANYDVPLFKDAKVHRDHHIEVGKALYSVPGDYIGSQVDVRADSELVKIYHRGQLIKTHPRMRPGTRSTDASDLPEHKSAYALRDITKLIGLCAGHGENIGIYAERILDDPLPWTRMRAVYRLIGLVRQYGSSAVEAACSKALDLDVIAVGKIDSMLAKAVENTPTLMPIAAAAGTSRFARDPAEYSNHAARTAAAGHPASTGTALASTGTGGNASQGTSLANVGTTVASTRTGLATAGTMLVSAGTAEADSSGTAGELGIGAGPAYGRGVQLHLVFSHSEQTHNLQEEQR